MISTEFILSMEEHHLLREVLMGSTWGHYGGEAMTDRGAYALGTAFLVTSTGELTLRAELRVANVEGFEEEYKELKVLGGAEGTSRARARGDLYYFLRGERVHSVYLVRDEVRARQVGAGEIFQFVSDSGIVVATGSGSLGFTLGGPFTPDLCIVRSTGTDDLLLHDTLGGWESDLEIEYDCQRSLISLEDV